MNFIRTARTLALALGLGLGLLAPAQAGAENTQVLNLDNKRGECPCFDRWDLAELIESAATPVCTYTFNVDRRLRIFDEVTPTDQAFTRAGVACFGPRVRGGNAPGLPGVGSFAMYDSEGRSCRRTLLQVASNYGLECQCINQDAQTVTCPDSL